MLFLYLATSHTFMYFVIVIKKAQIVYKIKNLSTYSTRYFLFTWLLHINLAMDL